MHVFFEWAVIVFEVLGVLVMLAGIPVCVIWTIATWRRRHAADAVVSAMRRSIGLAILLGLELLVAADIVKTLTAPEPQDVAVLGGIVIIRTVLSFALQIEIDGTLPWRRALVTTAPQLIARAVEAERATPPSAPAE